MAEKTIKESTRYDRQIRVWGAEAQFRLQNAKVLIINFTNLNVEVAKNLVLAGVHVTIADNRIVSVNDLANNFFLSMEDVGRPITEAVVGRVQELNTLVTVQTINAPCSSLNTEFLQGFDVVLLSGESEIEAQRVSEATRTRPSGGAAFFWSDASGDEGIFFADFGAKFQYAPDPQQSSQNSGESNAVKSLQSVSFPSLSQVLNVPWSKIPSRHQPLSRVFVDARVIHRYRNGGKANPDGTTQPQELSDLLAALLAENGLDRDSFLPECPSINWDTEFQKLCANQQVGTILTVSMLGSFLSQEVIKAISRTGEPGTNVFTFDGDSVTVRSFPIVVASY